MEFLLGLVLGYAVIEGLVKVFNVPDFIAIPFVILVGLFLIIKYGLK